MATNCDPKEETMATANKPSCDAASIIRDHYADIHRILRLSPPTLESLANQFFQAHIIDLDVKLAITTDPNGKPHGATILLDHLILKVEQDTQYLPRILSIMITAASLTDIIQRMCDGINTEQMELLQLQEPLTMLTMDSIDQSMMDTVAEAESLQESFFQLTMEVIQASVQLDVSRVKLRIKLFFQTHRLNTILQYQQVLADLDTNIASNDAAIHFMIDKNLIGYLNFVLLKHVFQNCFKDLDRHDVVTKLDSYEQQHEHFLRNNLKNIVSVFKHKQRLAPASMVGLPDITITLNEPWLNRSYCTWNELMCNIGILPHHVMIKEMRMNCITIVYSILPAFLSAIAKRLNDVIVLNKAGVTVVISDELMMIGLSECHHNY